MKWEDEAIILGVKAYGERNSIVELLSRNHGRYSGMVRGGRSAGNRPILQLGNHVFARWNARLEHQLGFLQFEISTPFAAAIIQDIILLYGVQSIVGLLKILPER